MDPIVPWTADRVAESLVLAFRLMPFHPVFSAAGGRFAMDGRPGMTEVLAWPARYVADPQARTVLMTWARCRAMGESVRDQYRGLGWSRSSAERRRREALAQITDSLNEHLIFGLTVRPSELEPDH